MTDNRTDEEKEALKKLQQAVVDYHIACGDPSYINGWVLILHKFHPDHINRSGSTVGHIFSEEIDYFTARGIIDSVNDTMKSVLKDV